MSGQERRGAAAAVAGVLGGGCGGDLFAAGTAGAAATAGACGACGGSAIHRRLGPARPDRPPVPWAAAVGQQRGSAARVGASRALYFPKKRYLPAALRAFANFGRDR